MVSITAAIVERLKFIKTLTKITIFINKSYIWKGINR